MCLVAMPSGELIGKIPNPAVGTELLLEISLWLSQKIEWSDIISRLRTRTVPSGYAVSKWKNGKIILGIVYRYYCTCLDIEDETEV